MGKNVKYSFAQVKSSKGIYAMVDLKELGDRNAWELRKAVRYPRFDDGHGLGSRRVAVTEQK